MNTHSIYLWTQTYSDSNAIYNMQLDLYMKASAVSNHSIRCTFLKYILRSQKKILSLRQIHSKFADISESGLENRIFAQKPLAK